MLRFITHILMNGMFFLLAFMPYFIFRAVTLPCAWIMYVVSKKLRRQAVESLGIAYGEALSAREKKRIARASFFNLFLGLTDLAYFIARPGRSLNVFTVEGIEHLKAAHKAGSGAVLCIAHLGPFAAMLVRLFYEEFQLRVVMRAPKSRVWRDELLAHPKRLAPQPIYSTPLRGCVTACFQALKNNELLVMPVDQNYGGAGRIFVDFFGRKAATAAGPAIYAWKTGAPLLMAMARPETILGGRRWVIGVEPVMMDRTLPEQEAVALATQEMTRRLEVFVRQYPPLWSWMHRRWKAEPNELDVLRAARTAA
ncbi:MAG: lysophospholipid acyltransferase family protein [Candidatus Omnitrophota bacterium]